MLFEKCAHRSLPLLSQLICDAEEDPLGDIYHFIFVNYFFFNLFLIFLLVHFNVFVQLVIIYLLHDNLHHLVIFLVVWRLLPPSFLLEVILIIRIVVIIIVISTIFLFLVLLILNELVCVIVFVGVIGYLLIRVIFIILFDLLAWSQLCFWLVSHLQLFESWWLRSVLEWLRRLLILLSYERVKELDQIFVLHLLGVFTAHENVVEHIVDDIVIKLFVDGYDCFL